MITVVTILLLAVIAIAFIAFLTYEQSYTKEEIDQQTASFDSSEYISDETLLRNRIKKAHSYE